MISGSVRSDDTRKIPAKIAIGLLFGVAGYLGSLLLDGDRSDIVLGVAMSLFVGGVAFVVQFLYEVEKRLAGMANAYEMQSVKTEERICAEFKKISAATELFSAVEASALKTDAMTQLVRNSTRIESSPPLMFEFAQAEILRLSEMLKTVSEGADVTYEGEDRDWLLGLTNVTASTIDATSLTTVDAGGRGFVDGGLWISDLGQRYLDTQREAIKRGVVIRRIFIMDRPDLSTDPGFLEVCRQHSSIGISVRVLDPSREPELRRGSLFDFVIFDGVLSYQTTPASRIGDGAPPIIINTQLVTRKLAVLDRIQRFHDLWQAAQKIDE